MAIFSEVDVHASEGDTSKMFNLNSTTLYEIRTMLDINADEELPQDFEKPKLSICVNKEKIAVGIGPIIHLMKLHPTIRCESSLSFGADVCALQYLANGKLLIVILSDGSVVFINSFLTGNQQRSRKLMNNCTPGAKITEHLKDESLLLIITEIGGASSVIEIPKFQRLVDCDARVFEEYLVDAVNGASFISQKQLGSSLTSMISCNQLLSFSLSPGTSSSLSLGFDSFLEIHDYMESENGYICVRTVGFYVVALSADGFLHFFDTFTGQMIRCFDLRRDESFNDEFLAFEFLDAKEIEEHFLNLKLLLSVKTEKGKYEFQIRKFSTNEIEYQVRTSENVIMLPDSAGEDNSIILIDPFNYKTPNAVQLRFINEAHPEIRFEKLIACGRFDDAEVFAKEFNLDIQKVHLKRAMEMIEDFESDDEENIILTEKIIKYCELVSDHNAIGDLCISATNYVPTYQCIARFLSYASTRKVTDEDISLQLGRRRYDLLTFASICDCENNFNFDAWTVLSLDRNDIFNMFESAWALGEVTAGRVFWVRYAKEIQDYMMENQKADDILDNLQNFVLDQPEYLKDVIEFVQHDFGPFLLKSVDDPIYLSSRANTLVEFVSNIAVGLERVDPDNFPDNAVFACGMTERMLEIIRTEKTTPSHQRLLYNILGSLGSSTSDSQTAVGQLTVRSDNLKKMLRLKDAYQCRIAYNQFVGHTVESICFLILDRCKNVQTVNRHIRDVVMPYMREHGLKKDLTLLEYIKKVSDRAAATDTAQKNNPWDDLCICFAESIDNILYRCQAIIKIAKRSAIPWSDRLRKAVNEMFKAKGISSELRRDLNIQCRTEELSTLMMEYDINPKFLLRSFNQTIVMSLLARAFHSSQKCIADKLAHLTRMAQLFEIVLQKDMDVECTVAQAIAIASNLYIQQGNLAPLKEVFALIKSEHCRKLAAETIIEMSKTTLEFCDPTMMNSRSAAIDSCCIVARNYLKSSPALEATLDIANRLFHLQNDHNLLVPFSELSKKGEAVEQRLKDYMTNKNELTFADIIRFGKLVGLEKERVSELAMDHLNQEAEVIVACIMEIAGCSDELNKKSLDAALQYIRQIFFVVHQHASIKDFKAEHARFIIHFFRDLSPCLMKLADTALRLELSFESDLLFSIYEFLNLFELTLQCLTEMPDDANQSLNEVPDEGGDLLEKESLKIYGMSVRCGVLNPAHVGSLFDGIEVIRNLAKVGYSIFMKANGEDTLLDITSTGENMLSFWEDVFVAFQGNPYLSLIARNFAFKLPFLYLTPADLTMTYNQVYELIQKILVADKVDLQLAVSLLFYLPDEDVKKVVVTLYDWAKKKQNSRVVFYISKIAHISSFVTNDVHSRTAIIQSYRSAWWSRRLAKEGITVLNVDSPDAVHADFVAKLGCPSLYKEYCEAFKIDADQRLILYAFDLLRSCSTERDISRFDEYLKTIANIFHMVSIPSDSLCDIGFYNLDKLCPYNYKALMLLISFICQWAGSSGNQEHQEKAEEYRVLLQFLQTFERRNEFTIHETRWYLERQKKLNKKQRESDISETMDFEMETDHDLLNVDERQTILEKNYPPSARKHFPFHIFLLQSPEDYEKLIGPILINELDIQNVFGFVQLLYKTSLVCRPIGRTVLVTAAISNKVREVVSQQSELEEDDIITIRSLLMTMKARSGVIKKIATEVNKLPLCMAKIRVLSLVRDVGFLWLESSAEASKEREMISEFVIILNKVVKHYECEHIIDEYNISIIDKTLFDDGARLVQHIFAEFIDWNDRRDIKRKMKLATDVTRIYDITLVDSLNEIIENWIRGGEKVVGYLKPVMTGSMNQMVGIDTMDNLFPPLPYNDVDVVRMSYILSELNSRDTCIKVAHLLRQTTNESVSNLLQRLRVLCIFIRCLNQETFQAYFNCTYDHFAIQLRSIIINFAFKVCQIDYQLTDYQQLPAIQLVSSLVNAQSGVKQTLETFQLAAVLIIDREVTDIALIERTLKRLYQYKCSTYILMLLKYVIRLPESQFINNLPGFYNIVVDAFWELSHESRADHQYRDLIYFILSCPVEAGSKFKGLIQNLHKQELHVASRMVAAISGFPASKFGSLKAASSKDIPLINPAAMHHIGCMMRNLHDVGNQTEADSQMYDETSEMN